MISKNPHFRQRRSHLQKRSWSNHLGCLPHRRWLDLSFTRFFLWVFEVFILSLHFYHSDTIGCWEESHNQVLTTYCIVNHSLYRFLRYTLVLMATSDFD